jgi:hypothetical protein
MNIGEIFGYSVEDTSPEARAAREARFCRFRNSRCTKSSKTDPIGICSLSDVTHAASLCPVRFLENGVIFQDAARLAFGADSEFAIFPEIRILEIEPPSRKSEEEKQKIKKIGKVDFVLGHVLNGAVTDFAALEVQAAYFSGLETRSALKYFLAHENFGGYSTFRRPDFRSSAQKRLIPQLQLKVPVFRRWGKKFFVVVDTPFFKSLPEFRSTTQSNSELTWLVCPIEKVRQTFELCRTEPYFSQWDDVSNALREGRAPDPAEIVAELQGKLIKGGRTKFPVFKA